MLGERARRERLVGVAVVGVGDRLLHGGELVKAAALQRRQECFGGTAKAGFARGRFCQDLLVLANVCLGIHTELTIRIL